MASENFFQACQEGNVEKLVELCESSNDLDINSKDGYGMSALAYAARNGHVEVVRQLLTRGAERGEVLEQGYGRNIPEIAQLLEEGGEARGGQESAEAGIHQGMSPLPMQDGAVYMNGGAYPQHGYPMMPGFGAPQQYYYDGMHAPNGSGRAGHMRKESSVNLPPPDIARQIPCKFYPNCRYADKCLFAHPGGNMPNGVPQSNSPMSPSMSPPPMQPMFYQQVPSAYPYPGPYGAGPQPFYAPMNAHNPGQQQYGIPSHFPPSMIPSHQQQHMHMPSQQVTSESDAVPVNSSEGQEAISTAGQNDSGENHSPSAEVPQDSSKVEALSPQQESNQVISQLGSERNATATPPQQDNTAPIELQEQGAEKIDGQEQASQDSQSKPIHRRQSFNSFLHHHAIPFQPSLQPGVEMGMMAPMQPYPQQRMGPKNRRLQGGGPNGSYGKRMFGDRPACTFFANGKCRFGDECRFPHILPDGTDARAMQAQQRQMYASAAPFAAGAAQMRNGGANGLGVPASAPTGPQAEKKAAAAEKQQEQALQEPQQEVQQSGKAAVSLPSIPAVNGANPTGPPPVIRSNPSKTSSGTGNSSSRGGQSSSSHKKQQQQQQQQQQQHAAQAAQRIPTVNDFPALAVTSPNLNGQPATVPASPSLQSHAPLTTTNSSSSASNNEATNAPSINGTSAPAPTKVNFSAVLSAPAPVKVRASAEMTSSNTTTTTEDAEGKDGSESVDSGKVNGVDEKAKKSSNASINQKSRTKEAKTAKTDSYKNVAAATKPATSNGNNATTEDDEFQLVNRSRASNKRGTSNPTSTDGFAAQAKAVAA